MKPAVKSKKLAMFLALIVGGFALWWYFRPFWWLGVIMALVAGLFTFFILNSRKMERYRRFYFITLFLIMMVSVTIVIVDMGFATFLDWANLHTKEYYLPGQSLGTLTYPCTRDVPQLLLGRGYFMQGVGWATNFPDSLGTFFLFMVPYFVTGLFFSRAFCGWICPFGGLTETFVTGKKERWSLSMFKKRLVGKRGSRFEGLKEWVKDTKYGILVALIILSFVLSFPIVCIFCPVLWLEVLIIFIVICIIIAIFAILLPFMTKRRWFCIFICPIGATFALLNKISFFRIKMDKKKCIKCNDCVQECRMYALTPEMIENFKSPNEDCIRCGRCIEVCPEEAMDIYWAGTSIKARPWFITAAIITAIAWYAWFILIIVGLPK
jgi:ferredoxin-type protein NapH